MLYNDFGIYSFLKPFQDNYPPLGKGKPQLFISLVRKRQGTSEIITNQVQGSYTSNLKSYQTGRIFKKVTQKIYQPGGICIQLVIYPLVYQNKRFTSTKLIHATVGKVGDSLNTRRVFKYLRVGETSIWGVHFQEPRLKNHSFGIFEKPPKNRQILVMNEHRVGIWFILAHLLLFLITAQRWSTVHADSQMRGRTCDQQVKQAIGNKEPLQCAHTHA